MAKLSNDNNKKIITILQKDNSHISHITYNEFNVGNEGIIFNNKIGADTIINEVVSRSASELNGEICTGESERYRLFFIMPFQKYNTCKSYCWPGSSSFKSGY